MRWLLLVMTGLCLFGALVLALRRPPPRRAAAAESPATPVSVVEDAPLAPAPRSAH